jgi:hypothetical protein
LLIQQESLLDLMWGIWPDLATYGRKAAQFVDLLGYFALKTPHTSENKVNGKFGNVNANNRQSLV